MKKQITYTDLDQLDADMKRYGGPKFAYVNAVHDGLRFRIRIMHVGREFVAVTDQRVGNYILRGRGSVPSVAFKKLTEAIKWNLRPAVQAELAKMRKEAAMARSPFVATEAS